MISLYSLISQGMIFSSVIPLFLPLTQVIHEKDFFGGPYVPEFLFHRYGPLKIMTWSSLFLECTCIFFVWSSYKPIRYTVIASMILLHVGIELTMNMHIFELISIIGWCMFFVEPAVRPSPKSSSHAALVHATSSPPGVVVSSSSSFFHRRWVINILLISILTVLFVDTFPLGEIYDLIYDLILLPWTQENVSWTWTQPQVIMVSNAVLSSIQQLRELRSSIFADQFVVPYLYPIGLYQGVWNLYSGAPDTFCRYETIITTYQPSLLLSDSTTASNRPDPQDSMSTISVLSPDWGPMTWYEKKRWQRPMTMYEKFRECMCRDCFVQYQANQYLERHQQQQQLSMNNGATSESSNNISIASVHLQVQCEHPPSPPEYDDWWNWTGWFYANALQLDFQQEEIETLFVLNLCNDLSDECPQWKMYGLCEDISTSDENDNNIWETDHNRFAMTQLCRYTCQWCPERGYDADTLVNGTRISVIWPVPSTTTVLVPDVFDTTTPEYVRYFGATIIQIRDRPIRHYLLKYDDPQYNNEWFDPIILRERGYRLLRDDSNVPTTSRRISNYSSPGIHVSVDDMGNRRLLEPMYVEDDDNVNNMDDDNIVGSDDDAYEDGSYVGDATIEDEL
jgi:hypothetical protein